MPNGQNSRTVWRRVIGIARGSLNADTLIRFLKPCYISAYDNWRNELEITVPDDHTWHKLDSTFRGAIERALATIFGQTTRFRCRIENDESDAGDRSREDVCMNEGIAVVPSNSRDSGTASAESELTSYFETFLVGESPQLTNREARTLALRSCAADARDRPVRR